MNKNKGKHCPVKEKPFVFERMAFWCLQLVLVFLSEIEYP